MSRHMIRLGKFSRIPLLGLGVTPWRAWVEVDDELRVRFGWLRFALPVERVERVCVESWRWYYGVGLRWMPQGTLALIGAPTQLVSLKLDRPSRLYAAVPIEVSTIAIGIEDAQSFAELLNARLGLSPCCCGD
ncbi:MAG: hypothetical protein RBU37_25975 [Myxococcota bacterium]|nr:hypothetical protein [Myxococcota bacterium]